MELNGYSVKVLGEFSGNLHHTDVDAPNETYAIWAAIEQGIEIGQFATGERFLSAWIDGEEWTKIHGRWGSREALAYI